MVSGTGQQTPSVGALVAVRGRKWVVGEVEAAAGSTCVTLQSVEDGEYGRTLDVIWEVEPGRRVLPSGSLPDVAGTGSTRPSGWPPSSTPSAGPRSPRPTSRRSRRRSAPVSRSRTTSSNPSPAPSARRG